MLLWMLFSCLLNESLYAQRSQEIQLSKDSDGDGHPAATDCNDEDPSSHPGANEFCDERDNDCDGEIDEDAQDSSIWYIDADGDGYGLTASEGQISSCSQPSGTAAENGDCDDDDDNRHPGMEETWYDGVDSNCDELSDYDADFDGQDASDHEGNDCDDQDSSIYTGAEENWWNASTDNDCDGLLDEANPLDLAELEPLTGLESGDRLGAQQLRLDPEWSGTESIVLVAAPGATDGQGEVYAFEASEILELTSLNEANWILSGAWDDTGLGTSMAWIGSASEPGFVISAPGAEDSRLYIFSEPYVDTDPDHPSIELDGEDVPALGRALASGHDHDGDGLADLVVSRGQLEDGADSLLIFLEPDRLPGSLDVDDADIELILDASMGRLTLQSLGDIDFDGLDDLGIGIQTDSSSVPGGLVLSWARETGSYDMEEESSVIFYGPMARFGRPVDVDGDGNLELLAGPDQLYRFSLPLSTGTLDWSEAEATAYLSEASAEISGVQTDAPDLGGVARVGIRAVLAAEEAGTVYLQNPDWTGDVELGSSGLSLHGESPGDSLGSSLVFLEAFGDSQVGLMVGAPGSDEAGENAGALYRVPPPN